ncbi:ABC transporter permease [Streptomyces sp. NPDC021093]|uniref:ABC transporter permease n=1 Tax=Streptomyces sp. NPDC021093 TaxID=3365112 RepID=UPI003796FB0E
MSRPAALPSGQAVSLPPGQAVPLPTGPAPTLPPDLGAYAARHGLTVSGARAPLPEYARLLWSRRHFVAAFATARLTSQYSQARLGQLWQVLTPLLNAAVYYFVFGELMHTKDGVADFVPYLVTGVFVWSFTQNTLTAGTRAISGNLGLVRALHFPRAALPVSYALLQLQQLLISLGVLAAILVCCGQLPQPSWLLAIPALALQAVFSTGLSLVLARLAARTPDLAQLLPFLLRTWMYASGVMWSMANLLKDDSIPAGVRLLLECNPAAVYISLMRYALIDSYGAAGLPPHVWALAAGWALVAGAGGFVYFWLAEERYGRG